MKDRFAWACATPLRSLADGRREDGVEEPRPKRLMTLDVRDGRSTSPRIGAELEMGELGQTATAVRVAGSEGWDGALNMYVAARTMVEPVTNASVMG